MTPKPIAKNAYFYKFIRNFLMNAYKLEEIAGHFGK
jgi:hypothetical protein